MHVRGFKCMCMCRNWCVLIRRAFFLEKKAAHCPRAVLGLWRPGLRAGLRGWISLSLHAEAWPCSQLFVQLAHQRGHQGLKTPSQAQSDTSTAAPAQVANPPTPLTPGLFAPRPSFKKSVLFGSAVPASALVISAIDLLQMS